MGLVLVVTTFPSCSQNRGSRFPSWIPAALCMSGCESVMFDLNSLWPQNLVIQLCVAVLTLHSKYFNSVQESVYGKTPVDAILRVKCNVYPVTDVSFCCFGISRLTLWLIVLCQTQRESNRAACRELL